MGEKFSLEIAENELESLLKHNGGGGIFLQAFFEGGVLRYLNPAGRKLLDIQNDDQWRLPDFAQLIHPDDRKNHILAVTSGQKKSLEVNGCGPVRLNNNNGGTWVLFSGETEWKDEIPYSNFAFSTLADSHNNHADSRILLEAVEVLKEPFYIFDSKTCELLFANEAGKSLTQAVGESDCILQKRICKSSISCGSELCPVFLSNSSKLPSTVEKRLIDVNGRERYYEMRGNPILDEDGNVVRIIAHLINITAKKRIESLLRESEERYSSIFENSHSVILLIDPVNGRIADVNEAACKFYGYSKNDFRTMNISDLDSLPAEEILARIREQIKGNTATNVFTHRLKEGETRAVEMTTGKIEIARKDYAYCIITDVTSRCEAETELKHRYEFETIIKSLATKFINLRAEELEDGIKNALARVGEFAGVDHSFIVLLSNDKTRVVNKVGWWKNGRSQYEGKDDRFTMAEYPWSFHRIRMGMPLVLNNLDELPPEAKAEKARWSAMGIQSILAVPLGSRERLLGFYGLEKRSSTRVWTDEDKSLLNISSQMYVNTMERLKFEKQLQGSRDSLKFLSANTQEKIEQVRANIAREVHDELGQLLTALKFDVSWLKGKVDQSSALWEKCNTMAEILDDAVSSVQRISAELRPVLLDDLGLAAAIEWSANEFSDRTGIACNLGLDEVDARGQVSISLFRVAQEALTNIARHSYATEVDLQLNTVENGIKLIIRDNGIGITEKQLKDGKSYGIMGLRERISTLGGTVEITGEKGAGTTITVWTPLENEGDK